MLSVTSGGGQRPADFYKKNHTSNCSALLFEEPEFEINPLQIQIFLYHFILLPTYSSPTHSVHY